MMNLTTSDWMMFTTAALFVIVWTVILFGVKKFYFSKKSKIEKRAPFTAKEKNLVKEDSIQELLQTLRRLEMEIQKR